MNLRNAVGLAFTLVGAWLAVVSLLRLRRERLGRTERVATRKPILFDREVPLATKPAAATHLKLVTDRERPIVTASEMDAPPARVISLEERAGDRSRRR